MAPAHQAQGINLTPLTNPLFHAGDSPVFFKDSDYTRTIAFNQGDRPESQVFYITNCSTKVVFFD
ncbi:MAG TPA: hypothetical protein V6D12_24530 [Candidatus Obscuribacterales bacterium]